MILYRYIIKEHIFPFIAALSIIVFFFIMQQMILLLDRIISKGLDPAIVFEVFIIQLGWIIALAIPMAILTASLTVYGRMSGDNEITSIKASGQSLLPLIVPAFAGAAVCTVLLVFFNDLILPDANHRTANLLSDISRKRPAAFIEPKLLIRDFSGYTIYTEEVNARTGDLRRIRITSDQPGQDPSTTVAARGIVKLTADEQYLEMTLFDGETHSISRENGTDYFLGRFGKQVVFIKNIDTKLERTNSSYRSDREMSSQAMLREVQQLSRVNKATIVDYRNVIDSFGSQVRRLDSSAKKTAILPMPVVTRAPNFDSWASSLLPALDPALSKGNLASMTTERVIRHLRSNNLEISQYMVEVHKKYAIPFACLVFVLIGAPLGIMARRGGLMVGASYSIFFFIAYWAFLIQGEAVGDKMIVSPAVAMWTGNLLIGICGLVLMILMLRETTIRFDGIIAFWKKLAGKESSFFSRISRSPVGLVPAMVFKGPQWMLNKCIGTLPMYLIRIFSGWVVGLLIAIIVIFVIIDYVSNTRQFEHATLSEAALYYWYYLPFIIQICIPIVLLLATMFAIGRLAKSSELVAMKASGIGIRQLTQPLLILGLLLSIGTFYGSEKILPQANLAKKEIFDSFRQPRTAQPQETKKNIGIREFRRNFCYFGNGKTMYQFQEFGTLPQVARGVWRESFDSSSLTQRVQAESMVFDSAGWRFVKGSVRTFGADGVLTTAFDTLHDSILTATPVAMVARIKAKEEMSYWELKSFIEAAQRRGEKVQNYLGELDFKLALPFMNFIVILLGIAITARAGRKGSPVLFGIGIAMVFIYWLISRFATVFAQNGYFPTLVGAWLGNALFFLLGLLLYRRASR